jgi:hypothetical protein
MCIDQYYPKRLTSEHHIRSKSPRKHKETTSLDVTPTTLATGQQASVRDFIVRAANQLGITIAFEGQGLEEVGKVAAIDPSKADPNITLVVGDVLVGVNEKYYRPTEVETLLGDPTKAKTKLGWQPTTTLDEMIEEMIDTDLIAAQKNRLLVREGYEVNQTQERKPGWQPNISSPQAHARLVFDHEL